MSREEQRSSDSPQTSPLRDPFNLGFISAGTPVIPRLAAYTHESAGDLPSRALSTAVNLERQMQHLQWHFRNLSSEMLGMKPQPKE
ncbi:hypothetical protein G7K_0514-t1 [Saitoella complicata NRRL Y-17804]|uniref:Uncharacterized protein n=1 Tax=Saitoella complicata (strain BCRC 22490 / CBS 7301 / JCM 7358 / NBRC 10748 / NRRL Y-17804) TaxID=698492 RepID=A0A0E9N979_SAICN|nr:hypothetical protein G7K_0514-t1 [Saitoella complicata NRRL Y-17804]